MELKDLIRIGHIVEKEIHNLNKIMSVRKIKVMKLPSDNNVVYSYKVFKNG